MWDADLARNELIGCVKDHLAEPGGVLVVDETGFLKKGESFSWGATAV